MKRVLSVILVLALCLGLFPASSFADEKAEEAYVIERTAAGEDTAAAERSDIIQELSDVSAEELETEEEPEAEEEPASEDPEPEELSAAEEGSAAEESRDTGEDAAPAEEPAAEEDPAAEEQSAEEPTAEETLGEMDAGAEQLTVEEAAESAIPGIDSEISAENALAILEAYDADGYYLVNYMLQNGDSFEVFLNGHSTNASALDTIVHEEYHAYSFTKPVGFRTEAIYIGDQNDINVDYYTSDITIPSTSTWAETLPDSLRTFRFDTYVSGESTTMANLKGPYGLLNEFTAYCWGMHNQLALFPYYKAQGNTMDVWGEFVNSCGNNRQAYAEFRFWTLGYLDYMKANNKEVYKHFMTNQNFLDAYLTIKYRFESQIREFEDRCDEIIALAAADGISASFDGEWFWFGSRGRSTHYPEYSLLMEEMENSEYQKIEEAILAAGTGNAIPDAPEIDGLSAASDGITISWSTVDDAAEYCLYRKVNDGSWEALETTSGTSYTDTDAPMGICAYRVNASNDLYWSEYSEAKEITFNPFTDVPSTGRTFQYVAWAYNSGIVNGTSSTTFSPDSSCTRLQFVMMLWKMNGSPQVSGVNPFSDVSGTKSVKAVLWALQEGIIVSGEKFNPKGTVTRVQIVMMLWKMAGSPKVSGINPFTDVSGSKTTRAVLWAYQTGITKGTDTVSFSPNKDCTRLQLVIFLYKYAQSIAGA